MKERRGDAKPFTPFKCMLLLVLGGGVLSGCFFTGPPLKADHVLAERSYGWSLTGNHRDLKCSSTMAGGRKTPRCMDRIKISDKKPVFFHFSGIGNNWADRWNFRVVAYKGSKGRSQQICHDWGWFGRPEILRCEGISLESKTPLRATLDWQTDPPCDKPLGNPKLKEKDFPDPPECPHRVVVWFETD